MDVSFAEKRIRPAAEKMAETPVHDNGAVVPPKKSSKKKLMKQLKQALERNDSLREQVDLLNADPTLCGGIQPACSSTRRDDMGDSRNDSLLVSSMSSWTLGALNIPQCLPTEGETDIDKRAFEYWKDIFISSLDLINASNKVTKYDVFKIKAGPKLRDVLNTTSTSSDMPDEATAPFSYAIARLNAYFGSRTYLLSQRGKLATMSQSTTESSIEFVRRVGAAAKLCNYSSDEEMEAVVRVITKGAADSRVRVLAHRNWVKQGSMKDLIDLVRDREIEKSNEEEFQRSHGRQDPPLVAAISQRPSEPYEHRQANPTGGWQRRGGQRGYAGRWQNGAGQSGNFYGGWQSGGRQCGTTYTGGWQRGGGFRGNPGGGRGRGGPYRPVSSNQGLARVDCCWRCRSVYHHPSECPMMQKECRLCGRMGHIARACTSKGVEEFQPRPLKRRAEHEGIADNKIATIDKDDEGQENDAD